jgi:hypothetical protein
MRGKVHNNGQPYFVKIDQHFKGNCVFFFLPYGCIGMVDVGSVDNAGYAGNCPGPSISCVITLKKYIPLQKCVKRIYSTLVPG